MMWKTLHYELSYGLRLPCVLGCEHSVFVSDRGLFFFWYLLKTRRNSESLSVYISGVLARSGRNQTFQQDFEYWSALNMF